MTHTATKHTVALFFITAVFGVLFALPQASEAQYLKRDMSTMGDRMKSSLASSTASTTRDLSCAQDAVLARETAIGTAWTSFNEDMVTAFTNRTDGLVEAWKITNAKERAKALKTVWSSWKKESKTIHTSLRNERKAAWADFRKTMKEECRETRLPKEDMEQKDASGTINL